MIVPDIAIVLELMLLVVLIDCPKYLFDEDSRFVSVKYTALKICNIKMPNKPNSIILIIGFIDSNVLTMLLNRSGPTNKIKLFIKCINKKKHNKIPDNAI